MNKEVGKAIYELKTELERNKEGFTSYLAGQFGNDIDTVLNYIEELEKYKRKHSLIKNHYISKDKVRDKIEELEEEDLEIYDTDSEDLIIAKYEQRAVLDFAQQLLNDKEEK